MWNPFVTSIHKALTYKPYRTHKQEVKALLKELPDLAKRDIILKAYRNIRIEFRGEKGDRIIEFWIAVSALTDVVLPLYFNLLKRGK